MKKILLSAELNPIFIIRAIGVTVCLTILLSAISLYFQHSEFQSDLFGIGRKFDMDRENTIPTYISSLNLLISSCMLGCIAMVKKRREDVHWRKWAFLGLVFFFLSFDEAASLHEGISKKFHLLVGGFSGTTHYAWAILGSCLVLALVYYLRDFIMSLPGNTRLSFVASGAIFLVGALGIEAIGGYFVSIVGYEATIYQLTALAEESFEMLGIFCFIWSLFRYIDQSSLMAAVVPDQLVLKIKPAVEHEERSYEELAQESA